MTEYVYNELIRVYANACRVPNMKEKHIDMYIDDCWELLENMKKDGIEPNINILNSLVHVYANSLKTPELETKVLPLYEKYKIKHDVFTYQYLIRAYMNVRENDTIMTLYDRMLLKDHFVPN